MSYSLRIVDGCTIAGAVLLVVMSLWPGYASGCWVLLLLPVIGLLGIAWMVVAVKRVSKGSSPAPAFPLRRLLVTPLLVCLTYGLLMFYVPRRVAFAAFRSQFDSYVASAPVSEYGGQPLGK